MSSREKSQGQRKKESWGDGTTNKEREGRRVGQKLP